MLILWLPLPRKALILKWGYFLSPIIALLRSQRKPLRGPQYSSAAHLDLSSITSLSMLGVDGHALHKSVNSLAGMMGHVFNDKHLTPKIHAE